MNIFLPNILTEKEFQFFLLEKRFRKKLES